ncbi:putative MFS family arabinose efflux permease [Alkalihalobacillus xiaoxiensis]|uniref:MFS family arabinose efflux permease n=1 Tax=Shouchella xiaoxiensis TaxID=766895 RepID=A0ABS2STE7_9BACI|nr:putative MFS family arabinose efflux permease [Shouchella xiaoxiensis]
MQTREDRLCQIEELREEAQNEALARQYKHEKKPESLWQVHGFNKLLISYSISTIGQWFDMIALMVIFGYIWQASPFMLALIPIAYALPKVLFSQFAGVFAERVNKLKLMAGADLLTVPLTIGLFFAPSPVIALILLSLRASVTVVHYPAQQSLVRELVPSSLRIKAVTWIGGVNQAAKIIAPLAGGALLAFTTPHLLLLLNASAFFLSALILLSITKSYRPTKQAQASKQESDAPPFFTQWRRGWVVLFRNKLLLWPLLLMLIGISAIQLVDSMFPVLFRELLPNRPEVLTWLITSIGLGALLMMTFLNRFKAFNRPLIWVCLAKLLIALSFLGLGFLQAGFSIYLLLLLGVLCGFGTGIALILSSYIIQTIPAENEVSLVAGIFETLTSASVFMSPLLGALFVSAIGVQPAFALCGILLILFASGGGIISNREKKLMKQLRFQRTEQAS